MNTRHLWTMSLAAMLVIVLTVGGSASGQEYDAVSATVETCTGEPI